MKEKAGGFMKYSGWDYLEHMLQTCREMEECLTGIDSLDEFEESVLVRRAVVMCLLDLGELITGLGESELSLYPSESWHKIVGFRNRAAHGYHTMDFEIVYALATIRVPEVYGYLIKQAVKRNEQ
ncbi:MAG: DUF86 domain-containing protein [Chitinispirillales bacterium]|nr:DUF86 domain-containing protein [Chitinispirillales bacterium]